MILPSIVNKDLPPTGECNMFEVEGDTCTPGHYDRDNVQMVNMNSNWFNYD